MKIAFSIHMIHVSRHINVTHIYKATPQFIDEKSLCCHEGKGSAVCVYWSVPWELKSCAV